jgi:hypothetical protein
MGHLVAVGATYQEGGDRFQVAIERRDLEIFGIYDPVQGFELFEAHIPYSPSPT